MAINCHYSTYRCNQLFVHLNRFKIIDYLQSRVTCILKNFILNEKIKFEIVIKIALRF